MYKQLKKQKMKKIFSLLLGCIMVCNFSACSDDDYTDKYADPGKTSTASCSKLMTGVFYKGARWSYNGYWRQFTWENVVGGKFAQTFGFTNIDGSRYSINDSYANNRWEDFYDVLTQFRELQANYEALGNVEKELNKVFYYAAEVFVYDQLAQVIDAFGDVPFSKAGYLTVTGDLVGSYASYDSATDLYTMMLDRLGVLSTELQNVPSVSGFASQDFLNKGDLNKWVKYCNSLRLRLATRVASQGDLASKGQTVIAEVLNGNNPLTTTFDDNMVGLVIKGTGSYHAAGGLDFGDEFRDGFKDHSRASQKMLDVLKDDPRLVIMYSKNAQGGYKGYSPRESYADQVSNGNLAEAVRVYSRIDSTTVIFNRNLKSPIMTAAEVNFLKAEAYQRGWANGNAKDAFVNGVLESTKFYYDLNNDADNSQLNASPIRVVDPPADSEVIAYAEAMWDASSNKIELILTQKWVNFGYMQATQAWNDVRRTGYPELYFESDPTAAVVKTPPNRIMYPNSERAYNEANYRAQVAKMPNGDDYYTKLFWAK